MKFIFLDFDGVLNNQDVGGLHLDPKNVELLNELVLPNVKFVISSSWRISRTVEELTQVLKDYGFKGEAFSKTDHLAYPNLRGNEIYKWLKDHDHLLGCKMYKFKDYVILDDDSDMLYWQRNNYLEVDHCTGITRTTIYKCKKILNL